MSKAKIAVIGAGLMGHGIAQVFALAGHDVTITDALAVSLDTVKSRISTNLRDLGSASHDCGLAAHVEQRQRILQEVFGHDRLTR